MLVEEELARLAPEKDTVLTIGVFDGVHLGHKHLISQVVATAKKRGLLSGVVTFRRHPQELLAPKSRLPFLTDLEERVGLLENEGVDIVAPLSFTDELARLSAPQFISLLYKHLRMRGLVVGPDFALGRNREGDAAALRQLGQQMGFSVDVVSPMKINGEVVSSTAIRKAIAAGNMQKVERLAGRPFSLHGRVVAGAGRGTDLGFPTANLNVDSEQALPTDGVYASWGHVDGKAYKSMTNVGTDPTFNGGKRTVEVYVIDFQGDIYGHELKVDIVQRLRDERKFDTVAALKEQMAEDVVQGKAILSSEGGK
ncbi:MAG: bifunctional riboflavin kinase/FAD synthetase [Chloroflexota bacterium]